MGDDGGEIIVLRVPPKLYARAIGCNDLGWIARATRRNLDLKIDTRNALDHLNHLTH
jgi:hypothetical protein